MKNYVQLGYCCINLSMPKNYTTNRGCIKRTFKAKGLNHVSALALENVRDLIEVIKWNHKNGINVYRMSSSMFPWMSEYEFDDLPDIDKIKILLRGLGQLAKKYNQRLSFHPGHFNVLGSPNPDAITKTVKELNQHGQIMDMIGLPRNHQAPINIHCNGAYEGKEETLTRWRNNWATLDDSARLRLVIENDDKANMYSVQDLYDHIYKKIGVPITFDYHHHRFNSSGLSEESALRLAISTWPNKIRPLFHYSSCRKTFEDPECRVQAHADWVYEKINTYGSAVDIELECKKKNIALLKYMESYSTLLESYLPLT